MGSWGSRFCAVLVSPPALAQEGVVQINPYLQTCDTTTQCSEASIPAPIINTRCGDVDGCTLRISFETLGNRGAGPVHSFSIDDAGQSWNVNSDFSSFRFGTNGDAVFESVVSITFGFVGGCHLRDDTSASSATSFELVANQDIFGTVKCHIRIDD